MSVTARGVTLSAPATPRTNISTSVVKNGFTSRALVFRRLSERRQVADVGVYRTDRRRRLVTHAESTGGRPSGSHRGFTPPPSKPVISSQRGQTSLLLRRLASQLKSLLVITSLLAVWYASNIFFNIYNKQVLQVFPHATTCTFLHLLTASVLMGAAWVVRLKDRPVVTRRTVESVIPLGILHLAGFLATNMSLGAVNVSLTHTIKSLEPFFTVFLSFIFLGSVPTLPVMLTLVPIVAGVVIASATDLSFNWYGFTTAMASNLAFQSRNVISKKYMVESSLESLEDTQAARSVLDEINLFAFISIAATFLMLPILLALDGPSLWAAYSAASGSVAERIATVMPWSVVEKTLLAGLCRTADVLASYALLSRLNPVTHSVGNCVKRVVVIAVSIVFFKTPASYLNIIGTTLALSGVFAYSMAKRMSKDRPDLRASLRATIKLQNFLAGLVPEGIKLAIARKEAEKAEKAAQEKQREAAKRKENPDEPEYFFSRPSQARGADPLPPLTPARVEAASLVSIADLWPLPPDAPLEPPAGANVALAKSDSGECAKEEEAAQEEAYAGARG